MDERGCLGGFDELLEVVNCCFRRHSDRERLGHRLPVHNTKEKELFCGGEHVDDGVAVCQNGCVFGTHFPLLSLVVCLCLSTAKGRDGCVHLGMDLYMFFVRMRALTRACAKAQSRQKTKID